MVTPSVGAVVLVYFPFSDLSNAKLRPAIVLASAGKGDWILCQVTSRPYADVNAIRLTDDDFASGSLQLVSYARGGKLFTANASIMASQEGELKASVLETIIEAIVKILRGA